MIPLNTRIQRAIKQLILNGTLSPGNALPATRSLAKSLAVSRDTVETAYAQLHAEEFIERRVGSGSYVSNMPELLKGQRRVVSKSHLKNKEPKLSKRGEAIYQSGGIAKSCSLRPFTQGVPETRLFPLHIWEKLQRQIFKELGRDVLLPADPQGIEPLRRAIADYVNLERGARATAERVLILTSSQQAMTLAANLLLDHGDSILIEDPSYHGARKTFDAAGLVTLPLRLDQQGILIERLQQETCQAKAIFVTPSHQFPTGASLALDRRLAVIEWAERQQTWIIEDDYDSEFHYAGKPTACVQGLDPHDRTIYIGTFTKSLFPGLRIAYAILPSQLVKPMTIARTLMDGHTATITQYTLARFMQNGHFGTYIKTMRNHYARRLEILSSLVNKHLSSFIEARVPIGGLQMPCIITCGVSEFDVLLAAKKAGIDLMGLSALHISDNPKPGFLMGFAAFTQEELEIGVLKLAGVFRKLTS